MCEADRGQNRQKTINGVRIKNKESRRGGKNENQTKKMGKEFKQRRGEK